MLLQSPRTQCPDFAIRVNTIVHTHCLVSPIKPIIFLVKLAWRSGSVMDSHATAYGSILVGNGVLTELHVLRKGVPSLNDLAVEVT